MRRILLAALVLLATPSGLADQATLGIPNLTCETPADWRLHDYGGPSPGNAVFGRLDGNVEECGNTYGLFLLSAEDCQLLVDNGVGGPGYDLFCSTDRPADYDGHSEYAIGGGFLAAETGDGQSYGSLACLGEVGHHPVGATVVVEDLVQLPGQFFVVTADYSREGFAPTGGPDCGDNLAEVCNYYAQPPVNDLPQPIQGVVDTVNAIYINLVESPGTTCNPLDQAVVGFGAVQVPFGPGIDGTYNVFIGQGGVQGHIYTIFGEGNEPGDLPYVCPGHGAYS